ncbi:MAG: KpsF/GutQ family sugar-phosphate isomerase [Flammeovirgaceae bacterium]
MNFDSSKTSKILQTAQRVFEIEAAEVLKLSQRLTEDFARAVEAILNCKGKLIVSGMGKSGHIGRKIAATLASTGTPSFFIHPAEAFHGDLGMISPQDMVMGISNSGETEELIRLIPAIRRNGNQFIALCGNPNSTLVKNADYFLNIRVDKEACPLELAPTSSTTATLAMGDALAVALMEERGFQPENFAMFHPGGSLGRRLLTKVKDVMRKDNLPLISLQTTTKELVLKMTDGKLGLAIVVENQKLIGIITDGDLRRAWQKFGSIESVSVAEIMSKSPKTISPEAMLSEAEQLLIQHKITSLIVVQNQEPIGVVQLYTI